MKPLRIFFILLSCSSLTLQTAQGRCSLDDPLKEFISRIPSRPNWAVTEQDSEPYTITGRASDIEKFLRLLWSLRATLEESDHYQSLSNREQRWALAQAHCLRVSYLAFFIACTTGLITLMAS